MITWRFMKNFLAISNIQVDVQDARSLNIDDQLLTVWILMVRYWWSDVNGFGPSRVDSSNPDGPDDDGPLLTVWILIIHYCWSTLDSPQSTINYWWSNVDGARSSRVNNSNLIFVGVDSPLLLVNSWQSNITH